MTKVASWEKKKGWATSILKVVVMTTLRHTTKKQTTPLSVVLELGSRIFSNARLVLKTGNTGHLLQFPQSGIFQ
jgi:hypothetical protein